MHGAQLTRDLGADLHRRKRFSRPHGRDGDGDGFRLNLGGDDGHRRAAAAPSAAPRTAR